MQTLSDIQFWLARVKVAYATLLNSYNDVAQNGGDIDETLAVRLQAAQTFINTADWRIENTPEDLVTIAGEIYKIISFVGSAIPDISEFYNSEVGNTNIVVGNGVAIPFATNTIYGKVRLSVAATVANDPIAVGDNDPRLANGAVAFDDTVTGASINSDGQLVLTKRDGSTITTTAANILDLSAGGTQAAAISINGFIRTLGDLILDGATNNITFDGILVLGLDNVVNYITLAQLASELGTGSITANRAAVSDGTGAIVASATTATQIGYLSTTTSDVQTQLNNKQPLDADLTAIAALTGNGLLRKTAGVWAMDTATYLTANQTITLSGDVTGSGSTAIVTTIANDAVTFAKMQNINTARLLGRTTTGAGNIEEITIAGGLTLSGGVLTNTVTQYTDSMARLAISETITGITYDNTTGVFSLTSGYVIPTTTEQTNWTTAYGDSIVSLAFNTSNGNLTLTQQDGGTLVQDLDGRYLTANEAITLSGDVTGSGTTAISTTIANDAVTFAKMQNISTGVVLGRSTAGSGNVEEITVGTGLVLSAGTLSLGTLTANRALVSGATGAIEVSVTTNTQIGYLSTVTSNVQTQLDGKQTLDATLTALAAIGSSTIGIVVLNGVDSFVTRVLDGSPNRITINNANGSATNPTIDIASTYVGQSSITTLGTITSGVWNGSSIADAYILSAANWNEAYDEHINGITWNSSNGNLTAAQEDGGNITVNIDGRYLQLTGGTMTGYLTLVGAPINANHAATKAYVDSIGTGISPKGAAQAATTTTLPSYTGAALTLTGSANGALSAQDGVTLTVGQILLVKNESSSQYNGIYELTQVGDGSNPYVLTRTSNSNTWDELVRGTVYITGGSTQSGYTYYCTVSTGGTLGTTPVTYEFLNAGAVYIAGAGIDITGNTISIDTGSIVDSMISASAAIALNKLASTTASRALVSDSSGYITASTTTAIEIGYVSGVTSAIQTQINNKQPLDATLTALAAYNTNGILTQTAADTFVGRTITGVTNRTTVTNGDGVSGNPVIDISATYAGQNTITILGTVATGTWQATAIADTYISSAANWNSAYNDTILSASFNTGDGVLTLTQRDTGSVTVDLDGRYAIGTAISGTAGTIAKFDIGGGSVVDSIITESGSMVTIGGNLSVGGELKFTNAYSYTTGETFIGRDVNNTLLFASGSATLSAFFANSAGGTIFELYNNSTSIFYGSVTAPTFIGALTGNASTATALQTARTINGVSFNGTANITVTAAAGTLTGTTLNSSVVTSSLTSVGTIGTGVWQGTAISNAYIGTGIDATKIADGSVTNTEFQYINSLTSNAQTQLDNKQPLATNLTSLSGLTYASTSFVKMTSAGTFALDTNTYITGNQTITLSGDVTGSGTTSITTTIGAGVVTNAMLAGSIAASKLVGTDIATVGTITSGTWQGAAIADAYISSASTWNAKIGGSGTTNYIPKFTSSGIIGNSGVFENSTGVGVGTNNPQTYFEILGTSEGEYMRTGGGTASDRSLRFSNFTSSGFAGVGHRINAPNTFGVLQLQVNSLTEVSISSGSTTFSGSVTATSFINSTSSNSFFLLGGGGTVAISDYLTTTAAAAAYQPLDATLTALAAYNTNGILVQTAANTFTGRTITAGTGISVTNGSGVSGNPTIAVSSSYAILNQAISGSPQTASFDITSDSRVGAKLFFGTNGAYIQEVLVGATYQIQVVDSAGNITVIG